MDTNKLKIGINSFSLQLLPVLMIKQNGTIQQPVKQCNSEHKTQNAKRSAEDLNSIIFKSIRLAIKKDTILLFVISFECFHFGRLLFFVPEQWSSFNMCAYCAYIFRLIHFVFRFCISIIFFIYFFTILICSFKIEVVDAYTTQSAHSSVCLRTMIERSSNSWSAKCFPRNYNISRTKWEAIQSK